MMKLTKLLVMQAVSLLGMLVILTQYSWAADEFSRGDQAFSTPATYSNQVVLYQRLNERTLNTSAGTVVVPFGVELVDHRDVDDWYKKEQGVAVFTFSTEKRQMLRVDISK